MFTLEILLYQVFLLVVVLNQELPVNKDKKESPPGIIFTEICLHEKTRSPVAEHRISLSPCIHPIIFPCSLLRCPPGAMLNRHS